MNRTQYEKMTGRTRRTLARLPGGDRLLALPACLCAACYCILLARLLARGDARLFRFVLVPACCFFAATGLRRLINRPRPYDRFGLPPVGRYTPGKGRSLPSRHTASAAAIAIAVCRARPEPAVIAAMALLTAAVAALRVLSGHHDLWDVLSALALSAAISLPGYAL